MAQARFPRRYMKTVLTRHAVTAYLNLEPVHGVSAGEFASVNALCTSRVKRVVVGLLHPLPRLRGIAVAALQSAGLQAWLLARTTYLAAQCPLCSD